MAKNIKTVEQPNKPYLIRIYSGGQFVKQNSTSTIGRARENAHTTLKNGDYGGDEAYIVRRSNRKNLHHYKIINGIVLESDLDNIVDATGKHVGAVAKEEKVVPHFLSITSNLLIQKAGKSVGMMVSYALPNNGGVEMAYVPFALVVSPQEKNTIRSEEVAEALREYFNRTGT